MNRFSPQDASPVVDPIIAYKLERMASGGQPRVLDLFSGCGGISLGFHAAGFQIDAALEVDPVAARSHAWNFHGDDEEVRELHDQARDIREMEPEELVADLKLGPSELAFDVIVGGPPCQAYARVGRAKLREVMDHPEAFKVDPRANLFLRYLHYVDRLKPLALLMENVPDILNFGGKNVVEEMVEALSEMGYDTRYSLINSAHHGVPQMRDRVYLLAFRRELGVRIRFPAPTHRCDLPRGYAGTRAVALKFIGPHYVKPDFDPAVRRNAVTTMQAIKDLPIIKSHQDGTLKRGARHFTECLPYRSDVRPSKFGYAMRKWRGFEAGEGVVDHVLRYLPRDTEIFRRMKMGDEYPAAHAIATKLFEREARSRGIKEGSKKWKTLHRAMVPPYPLGSFPNRWWKLRATGPSRTLMAHIGKDTYSHIHYDDDQARVITPREAARLQSFPDGFKFAGAMNSAFRQIGNAVPPLMAKALAGVMMEDLTAAADLLCEKSPA